MQARTKISLFGIIFSIAIFSAGYSLYSCFFNKNSEMEILKAESVERENIDVKGDFKEKKEIVLSEEDKKEKEADNFSKSIISGNLFENIPSTPTKKEGYGNHYVRARSAIAIDVETGTILFDQEAKKRMAIASLTKMMTAVLVVEKIDNLEKEIVTISEEVLGVDGTVIGCPRTGYCISNRLSLGEKISALNLLEAMLMNSTNDAAVALAIHIAGSEEEFAKMMNKKAKELGLQDTNFCNPSGLDDDKNPGACYSTAYDIARISAYSLKYDIIWKIMKLKEKDIYSVDGKIFHHIVNTDLLLDQMSNCLGGKTGFTYEAGKSLMTGAHHPYDKNRRIITVILDDIYRFEDMKGLINWVFDAYLWP